MKDRTEAQRIIDENRQLLGRLGVAEVFAKDPNFWQGLVFRALRQGHNSGLDADTVDGFHASDLIARIIKKRVAMGGGSSSGGATRFTDLTDVPNSYSGQSGKFPKVKATEDGLEFGSGGGGVTDFTDLGDVPNSYSGQGGKVVKVKSTADGLEFGTAGGGGGAQVFENRGVEYYLEWTGTGDWEDIGWELQFSLSIESACLITWDFDVWSEYGVGYIDARLLLDDVVVSQSGTLMTSNDGFYGIAASKAKVLDAGNHVLKIQANANVYLFTIRDIGISVLAVPT